MPLFKAVSRSSYWASAPRDFEKDLEEDLSNKAIELIRSPPRAQIQGHHYLQLRNLWEPSLLCTLFQTKYFVAEVALNLLSHHGLSPSFATRILICWCFLSSVKANFVLFFNFILSKTLFFNFILSKTLFFNLSSN